MPNEHSTGMRIAGERPPIPVRTAVNLSGPNGTHYSMLHPNSIGQRAQRDTRSQARPISSYPKPCFCHRAYRGGGGGEFRRFD